MAFEGVLTPESAIFAGQAGLSHSLAYQNTPKRRLHRFPSQGPQVPPPVGKPEWSAPTVNRSTAGLWGVVAIRSRPTVPPPAPRLARRAAAPCEAGRRGAGARTALSAGGASLPNVIHWGWRGAPAPSNPRPGGALPWPPHHGGDAAFRGSFRPQRRGGRPLRERRCGCQKHVTLPCHPPLLKG